MPSVCKKPERFKLNGLPFVVVEAMEGVEDRKDQHESTTLDERLFANTVNTGEDDDQIGAAKLAKVCGRRQSVVSHRRSLKATAAADIV